MVSVLDKIDDNAKDFSNTLIKLAVAIDGDIENVIRLAIFKVFASIIKRSPVDTGAYRASHGISNSDPGEESSQGIGGTAGISGWKWKIEDGMIYIFNNQPYALKLEEGHSTQAPRGIYSMALAEFNSIFEEELSGFDRLK